MAKSCGPFHTTIICNIKSLTCTKLEKMGFARKMPRHAQILEGWLVGWLVGWLASNTPRTLLVPCWKRELYLIVLKQSGGIQGTCIESGTSNKLGQVENYLEAWTLVKANLIIQENITRSCLILAYLSKKKKKEKKGLTCLLLCVILKKGSPTTCFTLK